jgi:hypothetical protein
MVIVQQAAEARATGDLAICPVVIRSNLLSDELATDALVEPFGHIQRPHIIPIEANVGDSITDPTLTTRTNTANLSL